MFTGLVDGVGIIDRVRSTTAGRELRIKCRYDDLSDGESVAVNGACMTVRECEPRAFSVAAVETTLQRTAIGAWNEGLEVNLERALQVGSRLGGHIVQGHVDGVGRVIDTRDRGDALLIDLTIPPEVAELLVPLGSVAVDGVSLTVNALPAADLLQVSIINFTRAHTTLGKLRVGMPVHVEADILAKYVRRLMAPYRPWGGPA